MAAECHGVAGARRSCPGSTRVQSSQGGLPGGGVPCLAETGCVVCVCGTPSQTQSCKGYRLRVGRQKGPHPTSAPPVRPGLQGLQGGDEAAGVARQPPGRPQQHRRVAPRGRPRAPWGVCGQWPNDGYPRDQSARVARGLGRTAHDGLRSQGPGSSDTQRPSGVASPTLCPGGSAREHTHQQTFHAETPACSQAGARAPAPSHALVHVASGARSAIEGGPARTGSKDGKPQRSPDTQPEAPPLFPCA